MNQERFVSPKDMAQILGVPVSWIYERSRQGAKAIPMIKLGKYVRLNPEQVIEYFKEAEKE